MSKIEVDTIAPQSGTNLTIGEAGDSLTFQNRYYSKFCFSKWSNYN